jgi:hypothetical protein
MEPTACTLTSPNSLIVAASDWTVFGLVLPSVSSCSLVHDANTAFLIVSNCWPVNGGSRSSLSTSAINSS